MRIRMRVSAVAILVFVGVECFSNFIFAEEYSRPEAKLGMTEDEVMSTIGAPLNTSSFATEKRMVIDDAVIILNKNKVIHKSSKTLNWHMEVEVNSFVGEAPKKRICTILPSVKGMNKFSLEFLVLKKVVANMLAEQGYRVSENEKEIDTVVFVNFGISEPKTVTKTWTEPVYQYVSQPNMRLTSTHTVSDRNGKNVGSIETTTQPAPFSFNFPEKVYRGESTHTVDETKFVRHLILEAADYKYFIKQKKLKPFWKIITISEGNSNNLREKLEYLTVVASHYVEKDSNGVVNAFVYEGDPRVARFNGRTARGASK